MGNLHGFLHHQLYFALRRSFGYRPTGFNCQQIYGGRAHILIIRVISARELYSAILVIGLRNSVDQEINSHHPPENILQKHGISFVP